MDLTTTYMGLRLKSPLVPSASPLSREVPQVRLLEDAGAGAIVLHSLFEEQLEFETKELDHFMEYGAESYAEAVSYFPDPGDFHRGPEEYLEHVRRTKEAVEMPVIASLNAASPGGWTEYAKKIEQAGADGLELNIYFLPTECGRSAAEVERVYEDVVGEVRKEVKIPLAVKMHPYHTSVPEMARRLAAAGANGLALFNRFYQPDLDPENLEVQPNIQLSTPYEARLAMRWIAILYKQVDADLAATGGVHSGRDAVKMLMCGANVVHVCSALLKYGAEHLRRIEEELAAWMDRNEYESVSKLVGVMSQRKCPDPNAFERANYIKTLQSYV
ncbi:MAG: dihydroorotate dehydrogenase-like protein [Candidatus Polarisedimenticolia bacterium]|nr:dihydroorotate dehydrogenase-like protein [bacterium]